MLAAATAKFRRLNPLLQAPQVREALGLGLACSLCVTLCVATLVTRANVQSLSATVLQPSHVSEAPGWVAHLTGQPGPAATPSDLLRACERQEVLLASWVGLDPAPSRRAFDVQWQASYKDGKACLAGLLTQAPQLRLETLRVEAADDGRTRWKAVLRQVPAALGGHTAP